MPAAYLIVESNVRDAAKFKAYFDAAPVAARAFAGDYLARGGRVAVLRFPCFAAAQHMYDSPGYRSAGLLRAGATTVFNMVLVEGVDAPA